MDSPSMNAFIKKRRPRSEQYSLGHSNRPAEGKSFALSSPELSSVDGKPAARRLRISQEGYEGDNDSSYGDNDYEQAERRRSLSSSPVSSSAASLRSQDDDSALAHHRDLGYYGKSGLWGEMSQQNSPVFLLGSDVVAQVLTFLDPSEILGLLTMPLCKKWQRSYGSQQDLWKTMCLLEPFKANMVADSSSSDDSSSDSEDSFVSLSGGVEPAVKNVFGEYRLMFTSFVRCLRYLDRIQQDARNGRPPSTSDSSQSGFPHFGVSKSLKRFLQKKKDVFGNKLLALPTAASAAPIQTNPVGVTDNGYRKRSATPSMESVKKKPRYGNSMITSRLLGPSSQGKPSHLHLPSSCAIYSIVNWMVAYPEVEGIQIKCVATLPVLLEDESQRLLAQRVGLVEVVLRAMLRFPDCQKLHVAVFHAMVLLARPLGGREGMLFDTSMAETASNMASEFLSVKQDNVASLDRRKSSRLNGISGIKVMLDSMRRFQDKADLQAMACWAMVNLALVPAQKGMILGLGGIEVTLNAMRQHPSDADVQFRALFALINLVVAPKTETNSIVDTHVAQIVNLVVQAMTNFCSSAGILNRACLVLHNIAQHHDNLTTLIWTPHCYQMIEWCLANYPTDPVLRRAAASILHRLQVLLASNRRLRERFAESLRCQEELALSRANLAELAIPIGSD